MKTLVHRIRVWLIRRLAGDRSVVLNVKISTFPDRYRDEGIITCKSETEAIFVGCEMDGATPPLISIPTMTYRTNLTKASQRAEK